MAGAGGVGRYWVVGINPPEASRSKSTRSAPQAVDAMPDCTADATWHGSLTDGEGSVALGSDLWSGTYATPEVADATNPEELLAAAHASCFAMTAAYLLDESGYEVEAVDVDAAVTIEQTVEGFDISEIGLTVDGDVPDATSEEFTAVVEQAEAACPVSQALGSPAITVSAGLED